MSIYEDLPPLSLDGVSTYPLASRPSKVTVDDFAAPVTKDSSLSDYLDSLPNILAVQSLRDLAARMRRAHAARKPIIWGLGGHVVKTGLAPVILDLMRRGFVTAIAGNGSVLVHDAEIAMVGSTSEDVDATLGAGAFGGAEETGRLLNGAARDGARERLGLGVTLVRNLGNSLNDLTTANFDFIQSYRPLTNVVHRPNADGAGRGFAITGHHELTIPLLAAELICGSRSAQPR